MATYFRHTSILLILLTNFAVKSVDRGNFKTCEQSGFCKRNREIRPHESPYYVEPESVKSFPTKVESVIVNGRNGVTFKLELIGIENDMLRMKISENHPLRPRFEATDALVGKPVESKIEIVSTDPEKMVFSFGRNKAVLTNNPFQLDLYSGDQLLMRTNSRGLMRFEHFREKPAPKPAEGVQGNANEAPIAEEPFDNTLWEETFKGKTDSKTYGPSSVGMDFSFVGFQNVYGIPEHADIFPLRQTRGVSDPYRLYNLDVFEYELNSPMAIYGSIPFMMAHSETSTVGLFWLNAAETWVDVEATSNQGVVSSIVGFVKGSTQIPQKDTHWFSESGNIDTFFLLGPHPKDVMFQYSKLTGTTPLPPLFSIAYHQCRWNYRDQDDVRNVDAGFDEYDIPMDVIWLDLDHTNDRKYFTWDPYKFPTPLDMINNVTAKGRKMVTLVDPHIKRDSSYYIHKEAIDKGYYVKNKEGHDYEGWCWPGSSGYLDYLSPEVRDWWANKFSLDQYQGSTLSLYTWNDMNEPSVFSEPEVTMPKDLKHFGGWEHREIHNMYGMYMVMSTYKGHLMRCNGKQRPFILSRSIFAGSQRFGAVWTGDNIAEWSHLQMSIPMILSLSISGMSFSGADVGGFFKSPSDELMLRWYQAGAFQPFFRAHSHHETKRREPWLFDETITKHMRNAIRTRYAFLPYWYTLFYENEQNGMPPMRPLWMEFPTDSSTFETNDEYMVGEALLVKPVLEMSSTSINVYFPGEDEVWYDITTHHRYDGPQLIQMAVSIDKIPVFQRGGTIIPKKERIRRSSSLTYNDPYTLIVALNKDRVYANGTLYVDDFDSFEYRQGNYLLKSLMYKKNTLSSTIIGGPGKFTTAAWIEKVVFVGLQNQPKYVGLVSGIAGEKEKELMFTYDRIKLTLVVRKPAVSVMNEWKIHLKF